jgi:hypothetical protein
MLMVLKMVVPAIPHNSGVCALMFIPIKINVIIISEIFFIIFNFN